MDEAILIEIAQRFRKLEDGIEAADLQHARLISGTTYRSERELIQGMRDDIENALEACREDMVSMQEEIRKRSAESKPARTSALVTEGSVKESMGGARAGGISK